MIDRIDLPQIPKDKLPDFVRYLYHHGIHVEKKNIKPTDLHPIQKSVNKEKVKSIIKDKAALNSPIIVTGDNYIVDGHHRWLAHLVKKDNNIPCIVCKCSLKEFLTISREFKGAEFKDVHEASNFLCKSFINEISQELVVRKVLWHPTESHALDAAPLAFGGDDNEDEEGLNTHDGYGPISRYTDYGAGGVPGAI